MARVARSVFLEPESGIFFFVYPYNSLDKPPRTMYNIVIMSDEFKEFLAETFGKKEEKVEQTETFKRNTPDEDRVELRSFWGVE